MLGIISAYKGIYERNIINHIAISSSLSLSGGRAEIGWARVGAETGCRIGRASFGRFGPKGGALEIRFSECGRSFVYPLTLRSDVDAQPTFALLCGEKGKNRK